MSGTSTIPAIYQDNSGWQDAGDYELFLTKSRANLARSRRPPQTMPGAIEQAGMIRISREEWDAGKRVVYPHSEGTPLLFLCAGARVIESADTITQADIAAMF